MIKRAPLPTRDFFILRNAVARDRRISYVARGILAEAVSRPANWRITAETLAANTVKGEGIKTIRRALTELEKAGYLERKRVRADDGRIGWEHVFYDVSQPHLVDVSAGRTISPKPSDGIPSDGEGCSIEELDRRTVEEDVPVLSCPTFASEGGGDDIEPDDSGEKPASGYDASAGNWRDEDRALFRSLVGEKLTCEGGKDSRWPKGTWTADLWYRAFRINRRPPIKWPGRYLESIHEENPRTGVLDWLDNEGLSPE
ncbi:helix-turn-helix domain-containing protein [Micromonospora sp. NPDC049081]|uniref:helix-turn-helix domain-containing protein n=1 Tax=Micromonospora sp. NPDC049081 TaxID=3155150 RepID=UPI00340DD41D